MEMNTGVAVFACPEPVVALMSDMAENWLQNSNGAGNHGLPGHEPGQAERDTEVSTYRGRGMQYTTPADASGYSIAGTEHAGHDLLSIGIFQYVGLLLVTG